MTSKVKKQDQYFWGIIVEVGKDDAKQFVQIHIYTLFSVGLKHKYSRFPVVIWQSIQMFNGYDCFFNSF